MEHHVRIVLCSSDRQKNDLRQSFLRSTQLPTVLVLSIRMCSGVFLRIPMIVLAIYTILVHTQHSQHDLRL